MHCPKNDQNLHIKTGTVINQCALLSITFCEYSSFKSTVLLGENHQSDLGCTLLGTNHRRRNRQKRRQRLSLLFVGRNSFNSLPHYRFSTRMILKNIMNSSFSYRMNSSFSSYHPRAIHPILQFVLVKNN